VIKIERINIIIEITW